MQIPSKSGGVIAYETPGSGLAILFMDGIGSARDVWRPQLWERARGPFAELNRELRGFLNGREV